MTRADLNTKSVTIQQHINAIVATAAGVAVAITILVMIGWPIHAAAGGTVLAVTIPAVKHSL